MIFCILYFSLVMISQEGGLGCGPGQGEGTELIREQMREFISSDTTCSILEQTRTIFGSVKEEILEILDGHWAQFMLRVWVSLELALYYFQSKRSIWSTQERGGQIRCMKGRVTGKYTIHRINDWEANRDGVSVACVENCMMELSVSGLQVAASVAGLIMSIGILLRGQAHYIFSTTKQATRGPSVQRGEDEQ